MKSKNKYEIYYDELINLISGDINISSQYVIFTTCEGEYYGINVAKVEELIQNKNIEIVKSSNDDKLTLGVAKIRGNMSVLLRFDDWIGSQTTSADKFSLILLCKYSSSRLGLLVNSVVGIQRIELDALFNGTQRDAKVAYAVEISVNGSKKMCNILDFDQLTMDIYPNIIQMNENLVEELQIQTARATEKQILIAEDSMLIQDQIKALLQKMNLDFKLFDNGLTLLDFLKTTQAEDIGLIITDIEMPIMDGIELIKEIKQNTEYENIPLIAHTNMSNSAIATNIKKLGTLEIVDKLNLLNLKDSIERNCR